jgi:hypothetical protein
MTYVLTDENAPAWASWAICIDWNNDGAFDGVYEDVTQWVSDARWSLGLESYDETLGDERLTLRLVNEGGLFSPENAAGALYGNLEPQRRVQVTSTQDGVTRTQFTGWVQLITPEASTLSVSSCVVVCTSGRWFLERQIANIALLENVTASSAIETILTQVQLPPTTGVWILGVAGASVLGVSTIPGAFSQVAVLDTTSDLLPYVGDYLPKDPSVMAALKLVAEAERGKFYFDRLGRAVFWGRDRIQQLYSEPDSGGINAIQMTVINQWQMLDYRYGEDLSNVVRVRVYPRTRSSAATDVLWQLAAPLNLQAGETRVVRVPFTSAAVAASNRVSARSVATPSGADFGVTSGAATISVQAEAQAAVLTVTNSSRVVAATVGTIIQRGQTVSQNNSEEITSTDALSKTTYGNREYLIDSQIVSGRVFGASLAEWELQRRYTPRGMCKSVVMVNNNASYLTAQLGLTMGDAVRVQSSAVGHSGDYVIVREEQYLWDDLQRQETRWTLEEVNRFGYWQLGVAGRSEPGSIYPAL